MDGYQKWLDVVVPKMLHWPIFVERGTNPKTGGPWAAQALKDHFMVLCPFKKETHHLGGIMEALFSAIPEYDNFELTSEMVNTLMWARACGRER